MKQGRTKYNATIGAKIVALIRADTYTMSEICRMVHISRPTFYRWQRENPGFAQDVEGAREELKQLVVVEAKRSLMRKVRGYDTTETRIVTIPSKETDEHGKPKPRIKEQVTIKKHVAPDTAAIIFTLTNNYPENWRNKQTTELTGKDGKDLFESKTDEELDNMIADLKRKLDET